MNFNNTGYSTQGFANEIPIVVQLMICYFVIFVSSDDGVPVAIFAFGINSGAYVAEIFRGGIAAVPNGQTEAARSLGLSKSRTMLKVVLPQAFKLSIPSLVNQFIITIKDSSILSVIGMADIVNMAKVTLLPIGVGIISQGLYVKSMNRLRALSPGCV